MLRNLNLFQAPAFATAHRSRLRRIQASAKWLIRLINNEIWHDLACRIIVFMQGAIQHPSCVQWALSSHDRGWGPARNAELTSSQLGTRIEQVTHQEFHSSLLHCFPVGYQLPLKDQFRQVLDCCWPDKSDNVLAQQKPCNHVACTQASILAVPGHHGVGPWQVRGHQSFDRFRLPNHSYAKRVRHGTHMIAVEVRQGTLSSHNRGWGRGGRGERGAGGGGENNSHKIKQPWLEKTTP